MASALMSEALAGFAAEELPPSDAGQNEEEQAQARHRSRIGAILDRTQKMQRELRGRRNKAILASLQETADLLKGFQNEEWPPRALNLSPPEWMVSDQAEEQHKEEVLEGAMEIVRNAVSSTKSKTVVDDTTDGSATEDTALSEDALSVPENPVAAPLLLEDDPQTRERIPEAVNKALQTFRDVMVHPAKTNKATELALVCTASLLAHRYVSGRAGGKDDHSGSGSEAVAAVQAQTDGETVKVPPPSLLHQVLEAVNKCSEEGGAGEAVQYGVVKVMLHAMTSPKCGVNEASLLMCIRSTFHVYLVTKSASCRETAKSALLDMLRSVFNRMEAYDVMVRGNGEEMNGNGHQSPVAVGSDLSSDQTNLSAFASQFHTDSYLLFRALCKLSSKTLPGEDGTSSKSTTTAGMLSNAFGSSSSLADPLALNSKVLSLQLILAVMEYSGDSFCTGEKFIYAVQHYLCVSLLKNCMSTRTQVAFLSQKIFLLLVNKFKTHLKAEIEVFLSNIFLRVLESPNSSFEQKAVVVESLRSLCSDPVLLTQIFLNYDCDLDAVNLYKDIVHHLTKLSGKSTVSPPSQSKKEAEQDFELSLGGTEVLVTILRAFLKALGLTGGDQIDEEESASGRLRSLLQLDVGLADVTQKKNFVATREPPKHMDSGDDSSISSKESRVSSVAVVENGSVSSDVAGKIVESFEMKRNAEQNFELGTVKFTLSLKGGLQYFVKNEFVELDAAKIAKFFLVNKDRLDKTQMGEVLGKEPDSSFVKTEEDPEKGGRGFYVRILHHYVDALDFTDLMFDDAIRLFLSGFRLPGEAQKIDRIMEKFAEMYTRQNLDVFPSADTAFILAFSVIMLNTDLHNPSIKPEKRMTVESFIRNNRGISVEGGDLPDEFLTGIFNRIKVNPFSLKEDDDARARQAGGKQEAFDASLLFDGPSFFGSNADERKREKFRKEREEMMAATEQLFKKRPAKTKADRASQAASALITGSVAPADVIKPMFDVTWGPLIGTMSQVLECSSDERSIAVCLNGFVYAVRIAAHSNMSLARDTFVNSLAKFTFLGSVKEMKHKNIESIRTLLSIAVIDGEYLGESWGPVLQCISQLARLRLLSSGLDTDESFLTQDEKEETKKKIEEDLMHGGGLFRQQALAEVKRDTDESNGRAVLAAVNEVLIDRVFSSTVKLSARSIAHFIEQLVAVSAMEIAGNSKGRISGVSQSTRQLENGTKSVVRSSRHGEDGPRIFSLQRLVEVAGYNMDVRPRIAWAQLWGIMADHFAKIGCHANAMVTTFAIDSLKQLSLKFLEKPELSEFNFQRIFLRPFLKIMGNKGTREDIRELILRCIDNMIRTKSNNLRSGWKIFFSILTLSAGDPSERINTLGLAILQRLLDDHLHQLCRLTDGDVKDANNAVVEEGMSALDERNRNANVEDFIGLCRASLSFVQTNQTTSPIPIGLSMRALCHTACYADLLADHRVFPPVSGAQSNDPHATGYTYSELSEVEANEMVLWRPLLDGLAQGLRSTFPSIAGGVGCLVQRGSVLALRAILLRHGETFSAAQWHAILRQTLLPSIQVAAEADVSPVIRITSETPSVSSLDFVAESQRLPPPHDDEGLRKFAERTHNEESAPKRPLGEAELLVEASFADMRHGGDGNLSRAYELGKKDEDEGFSEQPFPDSWIATTAPIALGLLTDIATEIFIQRGAEGREILWPIILEQLQLWAIGRPESFEGGGRPITRDDFIHDNSGVSWQPCEALIRASCREFNRFSRRLVGLIPHLEASEGVAWTTSVFGSIAETLATVVTVEQGVATELIRLKLKAYGIADENAEETVDTEPDAVTAKGTEVHSPLVAAVSHEEEHVDVEVIMYTPYGKGRLEQRRTDTYSNHDARGGTTSLMMNVVSLDFATLYRPAPGSLKYLEPRSADTEPPASPRKAKRRGSSVPSKTTYWQKLVPALKTRCITAYCLQQSLFDVLGSFVPLTSEAIATALLDALNQSRVMAQKASRDEDLSHIFQEEMFSNWGDGVEEVEEALNTGLLSQRRGSAMFFLTQEASASNNVVNMLAILFQCEATNEWDREAFAEPLLLERMMDVLENFQESEKREGHLIDPNVWRNASESGGKLAIYCTSFASVVVGILNVMLSIEADQFARHTQDFFPILCSLVRVQSDEIRSLVEQILSKKIAPMLNVSVS